MTHNIFSEKRASDRNAMVHLVCAMCAEFSITHKVERPFLNNKRAVAVLIEAPHGLRLTLDFDGNSCQPNVFVMSWYTHYEYPRTKLSPAAFASVNPYHFGKATDVAEGFDNLRTVLRARFTAIKDGSAYKEV